MIIIDINGNKRECVNAYPDKDYPGFIRVEFNNNARTYTEWYPIEEFKKHNPNLGSITQGVLEETEDSIGIVSKSTNVTLTDIRQKWKNNAYSNFPIWISRGMGEGQVRNISSNNKNTTTISKPWDVLPDKTSQYVISRNVHNPHIFGNTLPQPEKVTKIKKRKKK